MGIQTISAVSRNKKKQLFPLVERVLEGWGEEWFNEPVATQLNFSNELFSSFILQPGDAEFVSVNLRAVVRLENNNLADIGVCALSAKNVGLTEAEEAFSQQLSEKIINNLLVKLTGNKFNRSAAFSQKQYESSAVISIKTESWSLQLHLSRSCLDQILVCHEMDVTKTDLETAFYSVKDVVADKKVNVELSLSKQKFRMIDLLNLQPGDIVTLQHSLEQPLELSAEGQTLPIAPYLVKSKGNKAFIIGEK